MSVSRIGCKLDLKGKGVIELSLYRHFAPMTVNALSRSLPILGRVTVFPRIMVCVLTGIRTGVEKQRYEYTKGEVAFLPVNGSLCFMLTSTKSERPLNPVGKIEKGIELLERAGPGDVMEIQLVHEATAQT